ncbi:MAG TPA: hypothetical protein VGF53_07150 [Pseudolabrys sp.]|jgi:hypothetical protein
MFTRPTALIIGAGSGVDINMPTGEALTETIAKGVNIRFEGGTRKISGTDEVVGALYRFAQSSKIDVNTLFAAGRNISQGIYHTRSIDNYIHTHRHDDNIKLVGKVAIVHTILNAEKNSLLMIDETKHRGEFRKAEAVRRTWLRDFLHVLQNAIVAKDNLDSIFENLTIVNFNYDRCIEHFLYQVLQELYLIPKEKAIELIGRLNIYHPYGQVAPLPWQHSNGLFFGGNPHGYENDLVGFAQNIRTYNEEVEGGKRLDSIRVALSQAQRFIFLGFHFHAQNMELIKAPISLVNAPRYAFATTVNRSTADVNAIVDRLKNMLPSRIYPLEMNIHDRLDCKGLFKEFATVFEQ